MKPSMVVVAAFAAVLQVLPFVSHADCDDEQLAVTKGAAQAPEQVAQILPDASEQPNLGKDGEVIY